MFRILLTVFLALLLLAGCSDSSRDKEATQALDNARTNERLLPAEQVISLYQLVIDKYPKTKQAEEAQAALVEVKRRQALVLFKREAGQVLERVTTVLNGYQAFSGQFPQSLQDLDSGGYMFDSRYLADLLPEGAALYLALDTRKEHTRMWLQQAGQSQVLSRTLVDGQLANLNPAELQALKAKWREVAQVGHLTQVAL